MYKKKEAIRGLNGCLSYVALLNQQLYGLFEYYLKNGVMEIGLALNPKMVGKGLGRDFVKQGILFGLKEFNYQKDYVYLTVNENNKPAIRLYEKVGFELIEKKNNELMMQIDLKHNKMKR